MDKFISSFSIKYSILLASYYGYNKILDLLSQFSIKSTENFEKELKDLKSKPLNAFIFIENCSKNEVRFESESLDLVIQPESVKVETSFTIKERTDYKFSITNLDKLSPIYEILPHNISFDKPVIIRFKNISCKDASSIYLIKHQIDNDSFDISSICTPIKKLKQKNEEFTLEFELDSFSLLYLGNFHQPFKYTTSDEGIFQDGVDIIRPGLNYGLGCFLNQCDHGLRIINKNFGNFDQLFDYVYCTSCPQKLEIKMIFFKTVASISFKKENSVNQERTTIKANGCDLMFVGNRYQIEKYSRVNLVVNPNHELNNVNNGIRISSDIFNDMCNINFHFISQENPIGKFKTII